MNLIHFLVILVALSGFLTGYLLRRIAKEEVRDGKKYFLMMEKILLVAVFLPALYVSLMSMAVVWVLVITISLVLTFTIKRFKLPVTVLVLVLLLTLTQNSSLYMLEASLVFLYWLPAGTLS
jgi:hypothetical protein